MSNQPTDELAAKSLPSRPPNTDYRIQFSPALRLLALLFIITLLQPAPDLVTLGPPQSVESNAPILAVHTRLTDEVEEWKIKHTLELVREMGATTIVEFFPWAYYHGGEGDFGWVHPDMVINHANAQGLQVIARIGLTPGWARPPDTSLTYLDESGYEPYAEYAAAFAARYADKVDGIIIGNEPNLNYEWGYRPDVGPTDYYLLLKTLYPAIKEAAPDMQVLGGALAPTLEPEGSQWGTNDLIYLRQLYELGAGDYFDALAVHSYGLTFPADFEPAPELLNFRRVELVRDIMVEFGDGDKPMHITEAGWNDHPRWTLAVRPAQRIQYTLDALQHAEQHWPYVETLAIWAFRYPAPVQSYPDYFTLVTPEFVKKPIYLELQRYATP